MAQGSSSAENGKKGGRPRGSISPERAEALAYRKALVALALKHKTKLAQALIDKGLQGDVPALKEIHERLMGKAKEQIELTGKDGKDLTNGLSPEDKAFITKLFGNGNG